MKTIFPLQLERTIFSMALIVLLCSFSVSQERAPQITPEGIFPTEIQFGPDQKQTSELLTPDVWTPIGPNGITANSIAVDPQNSNIIYAGGLSGLYKTVNGGTNWQLTSTQTLNYRINTINIHPTSSNIVFVWLQTNYGAISTKLIRSTDGGATWTEVLNRTGPRTSEVFFDRLNSQKAYTATDSVYSTSDGGITWKAISSNLGVYALAMSRQNSNVLYAKTSITLYKTTDGGQSWTPLNPLPPTTLNGIQTLQVSSTDQNTLYAGNTSFIDTIGGFYRSIDGGVSWQRQISGFGLSKSVNKIAIDTSNASVIYAGGYANGVYRSTNSGDSWTLISSSVPDHYVEAMAMNASGHLYCAFGGSIYITTNQGSSWQSLNGDLKNIDIFNVVVHPSNLNIIYTGTLGGAYRTTDGGIAWQQMNNGIVDNDLFGFAIDPKNPATLYAGSFGGLVYKTTDAGVTWTERSVGLPGLGRSVIPKLSVNAKNTSWVWINQNSLSYQSTDGGASWSLFLVNGQTITEATFDPLRPDTLYAVKIDTLFRTTNGGISWGVRRTGVRLTNLAVDPTNPNILYADSSSRGTAKSTDAGLTWSRVDSVSSRDIFVNPNSSSFVYAATFGYGIRRSTNAGSTWADYNNGNSCLSSFMVRSATGQPHTLFCATFGASIYRVDEMITSVDNETLLASNFALNQNYPNPFNPATTISFSLSSKSFATLKVFDVLGREVSILLSEELSAGTHARQWDATGLASGVYFYRFQAGNFVETKKLILLR